MALYLSHSMRTLCFFFWCVIFYLLDAFDISHSQRIQWMKRHTVHSTFYVSHHINRALRARNSFVLFFIVCIELKKEREHMKHMKHIRHINLYAYLCIYIYIYKAQHVPYASIWFHYVQRASTCAYWNFQVQRKKHESNPCVCVCSTCACVHYTRCTRVRARPRGSEIG